MRYYSVALIGVRIRRRHQPNSIILSLARYVRRKKEHEILRFALKRLISRHPGREAREHDGPVPDAFRQ
uniref:Uncharacterized protein n=1 Tax=Candidatus Kentrum sp. DK TaxID=2126562 RepID=A0A450SDA6_9GAMM|nr:MAG: hypothetical protein BECKDK2373B_GA0170837_102817 [Candidatus Kentron sp. DK]